MGSTGTSSKFDVNSTIPMWIGGQQVTTSLSYDVISPLTDQPLYKAAAATESEVHAAIAAAEKALPEWSETGPAERRELLLRAAAELERRKDEMWRFCNTETASDEPYFAFDIGDSLEAIRSSAGLIGSITGVVPQILNKERSAMLMPEPFGVVASISPWNCGTILSLRAFLGPIAMGNTIVAKASERAPGCMWLLADIFHSVGLPPGVLNVITHTPEQGSIITPILVKHPSVKKVNFTGSTAIGSLIAKMAGETLKPCVMELGGKAPAIVCEDADIANTALQCTLGSFMYAGQICMATERILVNKKVAPQFREALKATIEQVFADKSGMAMINKLGPEKNKKLVEDALAKGAKTIYGDVEACSRPTAVRPIVLEGLTTDMDLYYTESFGPSVAIFEVENDEEAIKIANDTEYGLASAVFTEDLRRGLKIAKRIETGAVHINSMSIHDEPVLPHGGAKRSGYGRFNGIEGLKEWVRWKTITWKD